MVSRTALDHLPASIVPIDNETHAMLEYAESAEAQSKFEEARQEIDDGKGIAPSAEYFAELNRRMSERARNVGPNDEA
jgi:hypothetical protein